MTPDPDASESNKFYHELHNVVSRWIDEGDKLTLHAMIGAIECVKMDVMDALGKKDGDGK